MFALISNNKVIQIESSTFPVVTPLSWIECDNSVEVGFNYDGASFIDPVSDDERLREAQEARINSRTSYLSKTDWYIIRELDVNITCPTNIKTARTNARNEIDLIEAETTLEGVEAYNIL